MSINNNNKINENYFNNSNEGKENEKTDLANVSQEKGRWSRIKGWFSNSSSNILEKKPTDWSILGPSYRDENFWENLKVEVKSNPTSLASLKEAFNEKSVSLQQLCSYYGTELVQKCVDKYSFKLDGPTILAENQLKAIMVSAASQVNRTDLEKLYNKINKHNKENTDFIFVSGKIDISQFSENFIKEIREEKNFNDLSHDSLIELLNYFRNPGFLSKKPILNYIDSTGLKDDYFTSKRDINNLNEDQTKIFMADLWVLYSLESYTEWQEPEDFISDNNTNLDSITQKNRVQARKDTFSSEFVARKIGYLRNGNLDQQLSGMQKSEYDTFEGILFPMYIQGLEKPVLFEIKKSIVEEGFHNLISAPFSATPFQGKSLPVYVAFKGTSFASEGNARDNSQGRDLNIFNPGFNLWDAKGKVLAEEMMSCINDLFDSGTKINVTFTGHSLGGADSQYAATMFLDKFYSKDLDKKANISNFSIHGFNNPGVTRECSESFFKNYYNPTKPDDIKPVKIYHIHADHDIVAWAGNYWLGYRHKSLGSIFLKKETNSNEISNLLTAYLFKYEQPNSIDHTSGNLVDPHCNFFSNNKLEVRDFTLYRSDIENHSEHFKFHVIRGSTKRLVSDSVTGLRKNLNTSNGRKLGTAGVIGTAVVTGLGVGSGVGLVAGLAGLGIFYLFRSDNAKNKQDDLKSPEIKESEGKLSDIVSDIEAKVEVGKLDLQDLKKTYNILVDILKSPSYHIDLDLEKFKNFIIRLEEIIYSAQKNEYLPICYSFINDLKPISSVNDLEDCIKNKNKLHNKIKDNLLTIGNLDNIIGDQENRVWKAAIFLLSCIFEKDNAQLEIAVKKCNEANIFTEVLNLLPQYKVEKIKSLLPEETRSLIPEMDYDIIELNDLPSDSFNSK